MIRNALLLIALSASLTACNTIPAKLPPEAYSCKPWPIAPSGEYGYRELGSYIINAHDAHADCKAKLEAMK